jgi:hypothetical protein
MELARVGTTKALLIESAVVDSLHYWFARIGTFSAILQYRS